ncbi:MAG: sodium:solute symporter, partial [Odoribacter sp.]|nr:sodium:solute symporter [Odoribacter sp.]
LAFSLLMCLIIVSFRELNDSSVINTLFKAVGYTYGPILALFIFGLTTRYKVKEKYLPAVCLLAPVLSYIINCYSEQWLWGYRFGFEILLLNALICLAGLWGIRKKESFRA